MNREINTGTVATIIAVVVIVLGFFAWRFFGPTSPSDYSPEQLRQLQQQALELERQQNMEDRLSTQSSAPAGR